VHLCVQLLPLMWMALLALTLSLLAVLKWLLVNRVKATSYQKYSWAFQTKALNAAIQVHKHSLALHVLKMCSVMEPVACVWMQ